MENLNAETIKKALECCSDYTNSCRICPYFSKSCTYRLSKDALALINSQEQRIKELEAETKRLESLCVSKDIIIGDLSKENERLRERNIALEQKLMLLGIDDVYVFKAKVKGE
jgi:hypothetical protein